MLNYLGLFYSHVYHIDKMNIADNDFLQTKRQNKKTEKQIYVQ